MSISRVISKRAPRGESSVRDHVLDEVRDAVVDGQLHALRVDEEHLDLIRCRGEEERRYQAVEADALAAAGGARDEQVRHLAEVAEDGTSRDVFAERHLQRCARAARRKRLQDLGDRDDRGLRVRNLDPDRGLARNRRFDAHRGRSERERNIVGKR